jgi:hypothetical protein
VLTSCADIPLLCEYTRNVRALNFILLCFPVMAVIPRIEVPVTQLLGSLRFPLQLKDIVCLNICITSVCNIGWLDSQRIRVDKCVPIKHHTMNTYVRVEV